MNSNRTKWALFIVPALIIGTFETIRHTLLNDLLPMELGNWITATIAAIVIALVSRTLFQNLLRTEKALSESNQSRAVFEERERLSRTLHDQIAQLLFYSGVHVNAAKSRAAMYEDKELQLKLSDIMVSLREIDENLRQAIFSLKHDTTESVSFSDRVQLYLKKTLMTQTIKWKLTISEDVALPNVEEVQLFGILQECITNVLKHANASFIEIAITSSRPDTGDEWVCVIRDNGCGFPSESTRPAGFGIDIMMNRSRDIGCELTIATDDNGTSVTIRKPTSPVLTHEFAMH